VTTDHPNAIAANGSASLDGELRQAELEARALHGALRELGKVYPDTAVAWEHWDKLWSAVPPGDRPGEETTDAYLALCRAENRHATTRFLRKAWKRASDRCFQLRYPDTSDSRAQTTAAAIRRRE
jgi:hypothetical protein